MPWVPWRRRERAQPEPAPYGLTRHPYRCPWPDVVDRDNPLAAARYADPVRQVNAAEQEAAQHRCWTA